MTGESYGGHYIPVLGDHIWRTNMNRTRSQRINLKGLAIGNGLCVRAPAYLMTCWLGPVHGSGVNVELGAHLCNM